MKKKVIAIVVMVALVMSLVACSSTQAQPVQESTPAPKTEPAAKSVEETKVETPAVTEEPKAEEPEIKEEHSAEASTETVVVDEANMVDGVDCTAYNQSQGTLMDLFAFVNEVECDELRVFVKGNNGIEAVLSDGDTFVMNEGNEYSFVYYAPKKVKSAERVVEGFFPDYDNIYMLYPNGHGVIHDYSDYTKLQKDESKSVEVDVVYDDGTEGSITITLTKNY